MVDLRFRQIHLDFHTSEQIPGIGSEFDPDEFADTLKAAHVNSVTCFSRCHHGWIYHDTARFPERRHPHLTCDLLRLQIEACHQRGIRVPVYITVMWDNFTARRHPEWIAIDETGRQIGTPPFEAGFYRRLCLNTPYADFLEAQTVEVCETLPVDGIFFDICIPTACSCPACVRAMDEAGLDPANADHRTSFGFEVLRRFQDRFFGTVRSHHPEATVFFNSGHVGPKHRRMIDAFTHLELESLPSGGWGYMHFPLAQRFARGLGRDTMGMTGKFHTSWGDFQSFKNPAALDFECLSMLALGAKCSIGDQLHPRGRVCQDTYALIGRTYAKVEAAEPWCAGARPLSDIAVFTPEEFTSGHSHSGLPNEALGATRILQESRHQFDLVDSQTDLSEYRVAILPDSIPVDAGLAAKLSAYVAGGGALLATHRSGLSPDSSGFALAELGVKLRGDAPFSPDFIVPGKLGAGLADTGHVMYLQGLEVEALPGAEVLSAMVKPFFNREWRHFCSHRHTPADDAAGYPGAVRHGRCIYLMHPLFTLYDRFGPLWCKRLVTNALDLLLPDRLVRAGGPSTALVTVTEQAAQSRRVVHLLHYVPERRCREFDIIEDVIPIFDVPISVRADGTAMAVTLEPQSEPIPFAQTGGRVEFVVPRVDGHQMVAIAQQ